LLLYDVVSNAISLDKSATLLKSLIN